MNQDILLIDKQGNIITELAMAELRQQGEIKRHIRKMRKIYQQRRDFALHQFQAVFKDQVEINSPLGGMALWVKFKFPYRTEYAELLNQLHIDTEAHFAEGIQQLNNHFHIRFGYAALNETEISNNVSLLYDVFNSNE